MNTKNLLIIIWAAIVVAAMVWEHRTNYFGRSRARYFQRHKDRPRGLRVPWERVSEVSTVELFAFIRTRIPMPLSKRLTDADLQTIFDTREECLALSTSTSRFGVPTLDERIHKSMLDSAALRSLQLRLTELEQIDQAEFDYLRSIGHIK